LIHNCLIKEKKYNKYLYQRKKSIDLYFNL
jgi:hypothetical protein